MSTSSGENSPIGEKDMEKRIETIHTNERVPGHPAYYEKNGLRTYGDDEDHDVEPPVRVETISEVSWSLIQSTDERQTNYELGGHGIHLDR